MVELVTGEAANVILHYSDGSRKLLTRTITPLVWHYHSIDHPTSTQQVFTLIRVMPDGSRHYGIPGRRVMLEHEAPPFEPRDS